MNSVMIKNMTTDKELFLELHRPNASGYAILDVSGVTPGLSTIHTSPVTTGQGSVLNSTQTPERIITLTLMFYGDQNGSRIEELRRNLYTFVPLRKLVRLVFTTSAGDSTIFGVVESNDSTIFSNRCTAIISIKCPFPYFRGAEEITTMHGVTAMFTFPFSNNSYSKATMPMSHHNNSTETSIFYDGLIDNGFVMQIDAIGPITDFQFYNIHTREYIKLNFSLLKELVGSVVRQGDQITINTIVGEKSVVLLRDGKYTNILAIFERDSTWLSLTYGINVFGYLSKEMENIKLTITHTELYDGI